APDLGEAEDVFVEAIRGALVAHSEADVEETGGDAARARRTTRSRGGRVLDELHRVPIRIRDAHHAMSRFRRGLGNLDLLLRQVRPQGVEIGRLERDVIEAVVTARDE